MPDNKLPDNEIKKALEICGTYKGKCTDCPAYTKVDRSNCKQVLTGAVDLINRLQEKNSNLTSDLTSLQNYLTSLKQEFELLQAENKNYSKNNQQMTSDILKLYKELEQAKAENDRLKAEYEECSKRNVDLMGALMSYKAEAYKEFAELVQGEIDDAIHSNYNAKEERQTKSKKFGIPIDNEDSFLMYCDGKIHALSGINSYIDNLLKEEEFDKYLDNLLKELVGENNET